MHYLENLLNHSLTDQNLTSPYIKSLLHQTDRGQEKRGPDHQR